MERKGHIQKREYSTPPQQPNKQPEKCCANFEEMGFI